MEELQQYYYEQQLAKEQEECTFVPNAQNRNSVKGPKQQFYKTQEMFVKKKDAYIEHQNALKDMEF